MLLFEQLNFIKAKNKYEKSVKKNQNQLKNEILKINIKQSLKDFDNFSRAMKTIEKYYKKI